MTDQDKTAGRHSGTGHSHGQHATGASGEQTGQFGEVGRTGKGTDLTEQMESVGPSSSNIPGSDDMIPWDPTGKIDDEVERRWHAGAPGEPSPNAGVRGNLGSPKGGGETAPIGDVGPGRYGGATEGRQMADRRYAGATDDAPTSPEAGATTTTAALAAGDSEHELRAAHTHGHDEGSHESWQGGAASEQLKKQAAQQQGGTASGHGKQQPDPEHRGHGEVH
ncbi:MAG TPA: hypothetical protein VM536_17760 [Chloroflexia bacterium]|nr:hypothetical protein [Chloroflexia bacterium]